MGRPRSHTIAITHAPNDRRVKAYKATWRETDPVTGRRRDATKFFDTEADAIAFKTKHEAHAAALPPPPPTVTPKASAVAAAGADPLATDPGSFQTFADRWLDTIVSRRKASTRRSYRGLLDTHVYPTLGARPLATIDSEAIVQVVTGRAAAGVQWGTQKAIIRVVSSCLRWAVRYKHLAHNPCLQLTKELRDDSGGEYEDPEPNPLSADQARALLVWLQTGTVPGQPAPAARERRHGGHNKRTSYPEWYPYFLTLLLTGMRRGEAAGWRWATIDLDRGVARLERNYSPSEAAASATGAGDITLKGKRAHDIELDPELVPVLRQWQRDQRAQSLAMGRGKPSPYVFTTPRGARILSDSATAERAFAAGMAAIGATAEGHTIHDCRDTFATLHLMKDAGRLAWVSWMIGHRQRSTTLNRYAKWVPAWAGGVRIGGDLGLTGARTIPGAGEGTR